jgi:hypothetical protein
MMELIMERWHRFLKEDFEEESREHEIGEAAEDIANQLLKQYGDDGAIKLLTYALDAAYSRAHGKGIYEPSELEREEFMQEPYPGARKKMSGKIDFA